MNLMPLYSKVLSLVVLLLATTVSVYAHPNIDRSTATNPEGVLEIEPTAYPLGKALEASSRIHPTEKVEETAAVASSKSGKTILTPPFAGGDGTSGDPYQIATAGQLDSVRNYLDKHFILTANVNLNVAPYNTGEGWEPIGNSTKKFTGNVNGNGYTIDGLFINRSTTNYVGLFGYIEGGTIDSVGLTNVNVTGKNSVGGLVGVNNNSSKITTSYATGSVTGNTNVGGLVGHNHSSSSITSSYATGSVTGSDVVGGLVGNHESSSTITSSYATGSVKGNSVVGGLVGWKNSSSITTSYATGSVTGNTNVGGLVGYSQGSFSITDSYATGSVTGKSFVGGFIGFDTSRTLTNNYWDTQSSGQTKGIGNGEQSGVTGKTSAQMIQRATFNGWDFSGTWAITENTTYPWLQKNAQNPPPKPPPPLRVPEAPTDLKAEAGNTQVKLTWKAPSSNGGSEITGYDYWQDDTKSWTETGSTATTYTVTGLTNGQSYSFKVRAVNAVGDGAESDAIEVLTSSIEGEDTPKRLEVLQNYPNPFNPSTNIRFSLPEAGQVRLTVYNVLGRQVMELANKPYQAGTHVVSFEAGNLSSGLYMYQLWVNGKWVGTHKMTLIK